ncbi:HPr family phosphocarrier protein [Sporolactobacillus shoreae]|uniref:HPr family phosphocarrier protein n=1 Tax=Sporolactobacillus shoreae TaxID=1465501 RepID=A0A4Z0GN85_9BACL|nr:HPr family phosphocarrier protein [Sporolactobacillus shoreae]TGA97374.1 HPr family phosphocarrier protein [Sporolactobacillus shoreae]
MIHKKVTVRMKSGLRARPAALFVQEASLFQSHITLEKGGKVANVKSIMGVMGIAPAFGDQLVLEADGPDENEAIAVLAAMIEKTD